MWKTVISDRPDAGKLPKQLIQKAREDSGIEVRCSYLRKASGEEVFCFLCKDEFKGLQKC